MTLFPTTRGKPKARPLPRDRAERCIPTGALRIVESSTDREARSSTDTWQALLDAVRRSAAARLSLLSGRTNAERVSCPWAPITGCADNCRCGGTGTVTVSFLRAHYEALPDDLAQLGRHARARKRS